MIGLVPADGLKLALTPSAHPAQGRFDPVLPVHVVPQGGALGAELPVVVGVLLGALHPDDLSVLHIAVHAAVVAGAADGAERAPHLDPGVLTGDFRPDFLL